MNTKRLKEAEKKFMQKYPGGFKNPELVAIGKKHKMEHMVELVRFSFAKQKFGSPDRIIENFSKIVSRSSMISVFEKPKFRDFTQALSIGDRKSLAGGLQKMLYGNQKQGFEIMLEILKSGKMARWSFITIVPAYFKPDVEVFIKPTTTKGVISTFELKNLEYNPRPSWQFYQEYRRQINAMKKLVHRDLSSSNAAFSGFLMMYMQGK